MKYFYPFFKILIIFICSFFTLSSIAQTIKGKVSDSKTDDPLIGATVHIEKDGVAFNLVVKLDGIYLFKNIPAGTYLLQVRYVGYKTSQQYSVEVTANKTAILNVAMLDNQTALKEVAIIEHISRESDNSARANEKNASNTMNVVSANAIAISPDVIVSNVLSRVSGISIDRSNTGDAQHVIIRGMEKQYNTTLINGVKIPSPDNKNRYVPLDIIPADLVENIEVSKTLTPNMEGDASGGVVNLVMKTAPDHLRIEGNVSTGYSQLFFNRSFASFDGSTVHSKAPGESLPPLGSASISDFPYQNLVTKTGNAPPNLNASLTLGNRFLNNKLGVIFSGTFQNSYQGDNSFVVVQENTVGPSPNINTPNQETSFQSSYNRQYSSQLSRLGTIGSFDYRIDANNSITLFGTYLQLNEYRVRMQQSSTYSGYSYQGYVATNGIDNYTETRTDLQSIYNVTLKGKHKISDAFSLDWTFANSQATHKQPDIAQFKTTYSTSPGPGGTNQPTPGNPGSSTYVAPYIINGPVLVGNESRVWTHNTDKPISGYLNMHYDTKIFGRKAVFSAGGMFRHTTRDNFADSYSLPNTLVAGTNNAEPYTTVQAATFSFAQNPGNALGSSYSDPGVYTFTENIQAGYGMVKYYISDRFDITAGERVEKTYQTYYSNLPATFPGKSATINYYDYLPSVNAKYAINENQAIRAAYFQSVLRPAFADFIPYPNSTVDDPYATIGNPYLQHTVIDNYDLRYEFFPGVFDEFMVGGFYKHLTNPIETVLSPGGQGAALFLEPQNLGNAQNYGAEFVAKKFFGNIGVSVNYTYTQSQITTPKSIDIQNVGVTTRNQTRPLQGQAANIGNASLLYKDQKNGFDAQLSLAYTGERIAAVSRYYGLDTYEKASTFLDFSVQKELGKHFIVFAKANNLLNTPYELYIKQDNTNNYVGIMKYAHQESPNHTTVQYDQYYARYNLGLRFRF
ncbi:MAG: TonB-dependent receptor domain-containing protein [Mucilaginibacter sp.]